MPLGVALVKFLVFFLFFYVSCTLIVVHIVEAVSYTDVIFEEVVV